MSIANKRLSVNTTFQSNMSKTTDYAGIDYGLGKSNVNPKTGIRYGVISQHDPRFPRQAKAA